MPYPYGDGGDPWIKEHWLLLVLIAITFIAGVTN